MYCGKMTLAQAWERIRRIRRRFDKGTPWVLFPKTNEDENQESKKNKVKPVSTDALALNAQALTALVNHYGPNPVHVGPLEKQVPYFKF